MEGGLQKITDTVLSNLLIRHHKIKNTLQSMPYYTHKFVLILWSTTFATNHFITIAKIVAAVRLGLVLSFDVCVWFFFVPA